MNSHTPRAELTPKFLEHIKTTGLTDAAAARAIGITRQYYSQIKNRQISPSVGFIVGAINAGLAKDFSDVAQPVNGPSGTKSKNEELATNEPD